VAVRWPVIVGLEGCILASLAFVGIGALLSGSSV
jgi:hypothetical protein